MISKIRLVVFDFDGTLVDSNEVKRNMFFSYASRDFDGVNRMTRLIDRVKGDRYDIWDAYVRERDGNKYQRATVDSLVRSFSFDINNAVVAAPEISGATAILQKLKKADVCLAVNSATPKIDLTFILKKRNWSDFFDLINGSPTSKADWLIFIIGRHQILPSQVVVVGDGEDDYASAKKCGCRFYPVGDARGVHGKQRVYSLLELTQEFKL